MELTCGADFTQGGAIGLGDNSGLRNGRSKATVDCSNQPSRQYA